MYKIYTLLFHAKPKLYILAIFMEFCVYKLNTTVYIYCKKVIDYNLKSFKHFEYHTKDFVYGCILLLRK